MSNVLEQIGGMLNQGAAGNTDLTGAFEKLALSVPKDQLQAGLAHTFSHEDTPPVPQMLASLFGQSNPDQKAGLLNAIATNIGPPAAARLATVVGLSRIAPALSTANVTPSQAAEIPPETLQTFAQHLESRNLSIVDAASAFYAQHPTLVKSIGAGALALLMAKISQARR